jgi:hypothetical protein
MGVPRLITTVRGRAVGRQLAQTLLRDISCVPAGQQSMTYEVDWFNLPVEVWQRQCIGELLQ